MCVYVFKAGAMVCMNVGGRVMHVFLAHLYYHGILGLVSLNIELRTSLILYTSWGIWLLLLTVTMHLK